MIARLITAVRAAQAQPTGLLHFVAGLALSTAGIALLARYRADVGQQILAGRAELEELDHLIVGAQQRIAALHNEEVARVDQVLEDRDA